MFLLGCFDAAVIQNPSTDAETMDSRIADLLQCNIDAVAYLQERVLPKIVNNNQLKRTEAWLGLTDGMVWNSVLLIQQL